VRNWNEGLIRRFMGAVAQAGPLFLSNLSLIRLDLLLVVALQLFAAYFKLLHFFLWLLKNLSLVKGKKLTSHIIIFLYHSLKIKKKTFYYLNSFVNS
jgi:hypothetical protein